MDAASHAGLEDLSDTEVDELLVRLRRPITQLEGLRARVVVESRRRRLRARPQLPTERVLEEHRKEVGQLQRMPPGEVDRMIDAGRAAELGTATDRALRDGRVGPAQARTMARVLATLLGPERDAVEQELLELAQRLDPIAFGRAARRIQARIQPDMLARQQRQQEFQRRFRATDTDDGGFAFSGLLYGTAAETARVALRAFRRPDTPDEHRTPEQRGADAFEQLCAAALAAGEAPTTHGVRPQVMVLVDAADLARIDGAPELAAGRFAASEQPVSGRSLRHLLDDAHLLRVVLDADRVPIEVSTTVRTVPIGLWRALLARDGGCVWPGCDAPASWCDVAHAAEAFADGGRLSPANSMLLCRRHHRRFDAGSRHVVIDGDRVRLPGAGPPSAHEGAREVDPVPASRDGPADRAPPSSRSP
ncbi:MAG: DUF222 domain-containing protein [Nitriliruptoraceae bacterium]